MNKSIFKELKDIRLISLCLALVLYILTIGFLFMFAPVGLHETEKQLPHAFDNHKYLNYKTFDLLMGIAPAIAMSAIIIIVLIIATLPNNKQPFRHGVEQ